MRPTLTTSDGLRLAGRSWNGSSPVHASVVIVHGFTASADCPHVEALAGQLHADGLDIVTYDARGHGDSDGESTLGDFEQHDVAAAVDLARVGSPRVVLVGASMGAIAAARYAATDPDLAGVVLVSCPAQWRLPRNTRGLLAAAMTRTPPGRRMISRLSGVRVAKRWTNPSPPLALMSSITAPIAIVHGTSDRFIPVRDAAELYAEAPEPKHLVIGRGMGHAFSPEAIEPVRGAVVWTLASRAFA